MSSAGASVILFGAMGVAGAAIVSDSLDGGCFGHHRAALTVLVPAGMAAAGGVIGKVLSLRVRAGSLAAQSRHLLGWCTGGLWIAMGAALAAAAASRPSPECVRAPDATAVSLCLVAVVGELLSLVAASAAAVTFSGRRALCRAALELRERPGPSPVPGPTRVDLGIGEQVRTMPGVGSPYRHAVAQEAQFVGDPFATLRSLRLDVVGALLCALAAAGAVASFEHVP